MFTRMLNTNLRIPNPNMYISYKLICTSLTLEELLYPQYTECIHTGHFDRVLTQRSIRNNIYPK